MAEVSLTPHSMAPKSTRKSSDSRHYSSAHNDGTRWFFKPPTLANSLGFSPSMANLLTLLNPYKYLLHSLISIESMLLFES